MSANDSQFVVIYATEEEDSISGLRLEFLDTLQKHFTVVKHKEVLENVEIGKKVVAAFTRADGCGGRGYKWILEKLDLYPNLTIIASHGAGFEHLPVKILNERGVKVSNTPGVLGDAVAEMAMLLMLASARNFVPAMKEAMGPTPIKEYSSNRLGVQVSLSTIGIIGLGDIGYKVAKRAYSFDMKILYYRRSRRPEHEESAVQATYCSLNDLLSQSDFIVLTCPLTPQTEGLIGKEQFQMMKPTATIINVARGKVIDQDSLVEALQTNRIRGAALDVTTPEPLPRDHPLLKLPNVILLPHHASATLTTRRKMEQVMLDNALACIQNKPLPNEVKIP